MPTPIQDQPAAQLRASIALGPHDDLQISIVSRHFAYARLMSERGQAMNHVALAYLPKHTKFRADVPRPFGRNLHLCSDRTGTRPQVAAILAARMMAGQPVAAAELGGAA